MEMREILERLSVLINKEMQENGCSIRSFSTQCEISYEEMRRIVNMDLIEPRFSTVLKICRNSRITIFDILDIDSGLENQKMLVICSTGRYNITWKKTMM